MNILLIRFLAFRAASRSSLARALQVRAVDVVSSQQLGKSNQSLSDEWQLSFAVQQDRAILTHNFRDFYHLDSEWKNLGRTHSGIILAVRRPIGELVKKLRAHLDTTLPAQQFDTLL